MERFLAYIRNGSIAAVLANSVLPEKCTICTGTFHQNFGLRDVSDKHSLTVWPVMGVVLNFYTAFAVRAGTYKRDDLGCPTLEGAEESGDVLLGRPVRQQDRQRDTSAPRVQWAGRN